MAPDSLRRSLLALVLLAAACGGGAKNDEADAAVDLAAVRAQRDSIRTADSLVRVHFTRCSDSVITDMGKTAAGKKKLAVKPPEGMIRPEVLTACGKPPGRSGDRTRPDHRGTRGPEAHSAADGGAEGGLGSQGPGAGQAGFAQDQDRAGAAGFGAQAGADSVRNDSLQRARETEVLRESFTYAGGSRDPFVSLISTAKVGPEFSDLILLGIYLDLRRASNSVAVLRDKNSGKRYKLRVGDQVGRLKVAQIRQQDVVFTVEDIGFERQETLSMRKREAETP